MPAPDPLAKLKALTKSQTGADPFFSDSEEDIVKKLLGILSRVPAGERLLAEAQQHGIGVRILKTQAAFSYSPESNIVYLGMPGGQTNPKSAMLINLSMGLTEAIQEHTGMPRPPLNMPHAQLSQIHIEKQIDIMERMCEIAYQLVNTLGLREILDELTKMGHIDLYTAYEEDLHKKAEGEGV